MNINDIQDLIKFVAKAGVNEVEIEKKDFKIVIKSDYMAKKKTNFKEEPTIVQQQIPVGNIAAQPIAAAPLLHLLLYPRNLLLQKKKKKIAISLQLKHK